MKPILGHHYLGRADCWSFLVANGSRTGCDLRVAWNTLHQDVDECCHFLDVTPTGPLTTLVEGAGNNSVDGSTRSEVVKCLESLHVEALHKALQTHHDKKYRPVPMFPNRDKLSQAWLSALQGPLTQIPSPEFTQAMAWHLLVQSPACQPHIGTMIKGKPMDPFGELLMCTTLPFDYWLIRQDKVKMEIQSLGLEYGLLVDTEPFGLFSHLIPSSAYVENGHLHHYCVHQGLVPDFLVSRLSGHQE